MLAAASDVWSYSQSDWPSQEEKKDISGFQSVDLSESSGMRKILMGWKVTTADDIYKILELENCCNILCASPTHLTTLVVNSSKVFTSVCWEFSFGKHFSNEIYKKSRICFIRIIFGSSQNFGDMFSIGSAAFWKVVSCRVSFDIGCWCFINSIKISNTGHGHYTKCSHAEKDSKREKATSIVTSLCLEQ